MIKNLDKMSLMFNEMQKSIESIKTNFQKQMKYRNIQVFADDLTQVHYYKCIVSGKRFNTKEELDNYLNETK
jgi:hypothetical protein